MNLFGQKKPDPVTMPSIDQAQAKVNTLRKARKGTSRAAAMLTAGKGSPQIAKRKVTGN